MSKIYENEKTALENRERFSYNLGIICDNLYKNINILRDVNSNKDDVIEAFCNSTKLVKQRETLETLIEEIDCDIKDRVYNPNNFISRHFIDITEYKNINRGWCTNFRDDNRQWYFAELTKDFDNKPIAYIYTLKFKKFASVNIRERILVNNDIKNSEYNSNSLIKFIKSFINGDFDINQDNAYRPD